MRIYLWRRYGMKGGTRQEDRHTHTHTATKSTHSHYKIVQMSLSNGRSATIITVCVCVCFCVQTNNYAQVDLMHSRRLLLKNMRFLWTQAGNSYLSTLHWLMGGLAGWLVGLVAHTRAPSLSFGSYITVLSTFTTTMSLHRSCWW